MPKPTQDALKTFRTLRRVSQALRLDTRKAGLELGLGKAQLQALSVIHQQPDIGTGDLAKAMEVQPSTASNLVKPLIAKGLVEVEHSKLDRRNVKLRSTAQAKAILKQAPRAWSGPVLEALQTMDPSSLASLQQSLDQLLLTLGPRQSNTR
ncbi:MAG: MarR family transcriptional regulator [Betaproteobacteria bacterium]|nr:MarR family transcriptional regulator [Betaproteobacteria bacterium]